MTTDISDIFNKASNYLCQNKNIKVSNNDKLSLYGFYKQATSGKCNISKPKGIDMVQNAKWEQWNNFDEMTKEEAMENYIQIVKKLNINF
tara:strand:+ start:238 stop:507 length:270 start_codon:yes stop_codon:yes gene_type:complete